MASGGAAGGGADAAFRVSSLGAEVSPAERTQLLTTLAKEAKTYPQLHTFFYPNGQKSTDTSTNHSNADGSRKTSTHSSGKSNEEGTAASTALTSDEADVVFATWDAREGDVATLSERDTVEWLTLLRLHRHLTQDAGNAAADVQQRAWDALTASLHARVQQILAAAGGGHGEDEKKATPTMTSAAASTIAMVLHVLIDAYRDQLAVGASAATTAAHPHAASRNEDNDASNSGTGQRRRRPRRSAAQMRRLEKQRAEVSAVHARVSRVLADLVAPRYGVALATTTTITTTAATGPDEQDS